MSGMYNNGEQKVRPGNYFRYVSGGSSAQGVRGGVAAVVFGADWGPLNQVVTLTDGEADVFCGTGNAGIIELARLGGAATVVCVRAGDGGGASSLSLMDASGTEAVKLTAKYVGGRPLSATVRGSITDESVRELIIYSGAELILAVQFEKSEAESAALVQAINSADESPVKAALSAEAALADVAQAAFKGGVNPALASKDYANALVALEGVNWNTVSADSSDIAITELLRAFVVRARGDGILGMAVAGADMTSSFTERLERALTYNTSDLVYVVNGWIDADRREISGWRAAAVISGMIAQAPSNTSLTHQRVPGADEPLGAFTGGQIERALESGCLVITRSRGGAVWIESGINTLTVPGSDQDAGWKKIRRHKCRSELIMRVDLAVEGLIGTVNNDQNGRATYIAAATGVAQDMIAEGKLLNCAISEDPARPAAGDSAWFVFEVIDLDSIEHTYDTFVFRFGDA